MLRSSRLTRRGRPFESLRYLPPYPPPSSIAHHQHNNKPSMSSKPSSFYLREGVDFQPQGPNRIGSYHVQLFQPFPLLEPLYMEWEKTYDPEPTWKFMQTIPYVPIAAVIIYVIAIFAGQQAMKSRERWDLRYPLAYWNLFLSIFSFMGMARVVPHCLYLASTRGMHTVACGHPEPLYGNAAVGFWVQAFVISKLFELIDTAFIVLRKRPLLFLHWYHHVTVLLFTWFCYTHQNPGIIFIAMNYTVHAVMYGYYFVEAYKIRPAWLKPQIITGMQISQMVVGVGVAVYYIITLRRGGDCAVDTKLLISCGVMYSTYLYLFAEFFIKRFITGAQRQVKRAVSLVREGSIHLQRSLSLTGREPSNKKDA